MTMRRLLFWQTKVGAFYIVANGGKYYPVFDDQFLGSYDDPQHAIDDLAGGHTYPISVGADTAKLGISYDMAEWQRCSP
jgi:hypothetical protein